MRFRLVKEALQARLELARPAYQPQFETNFFGAVRVMQALLPTMVKQRYGTIVNVSSLGGRITFPFDSAYHGTKFALEGLSESIQ